MAVGLATEERQRPDDANPGITCHELVRERIRTWMRDHPQDQADLTENTIRLAYMERLEAAFNALQHQNMTAALQAGSRALVYCVQAGAYDWLGGFASWVVTSTSDPRLLEGLLPPLKAAAEAAPEGRPRWRCLSILADALVSAGRPDTSLHFYEQATTHVRIAAQAQTLGQVKFDQICLAAPDVDRDLFLDLARLYPEHAERTTLYVSNGDLPVHLSAKLHDAPRSGYFIPYTVAPGIDTVAVPDFDIDLLGHSYFAQAEALLHDIHDLMRHNEAPAQRQRITPAVHEGTAFWRLRR